MERFLVAMTLLLAALVPAGPARADDPSQPANARHWPAAVAPVSGTVHRAFEQPDGPYGRGHRGVDLVTRRSEVVRVAMPGTVRFSGSVAGEMWITVTHAEGLETTYGGVEPTVRVGERLGIGQPIAWMRAGRRHLHWGARLRGAYIDPIGLLSGWRVRLVAPSIQR